MSKLAVELVLTFLVIALTILDKLVSTRWKVLPKEQCQGIRNYIVSVMIKTSSDDATMIRERTYLNKLRLTLVAVCLLYADPVLTDSARYSNKIGPGIGLLSFRKLYKPARQIYHFVKTT